MNPYVHDPGWGWWIIWYFYLGGLAAGCYFVATLVELFGRDEDRPLAHLGYRLAFPLIAICGVLLILDLERPERFWHMVLQSELVDQALAAGWPLGGWGLMVRAAMLKWWSPMSIGAQALGIFGLCSFLSLLGTLWPKGRIARVLSSHWVGRTFKVLGSVVGFFVAAYTGALLTATNQPLWSGSDWVGPLFLTSAASTGIALLLLLAGHLRQETRERLERADLWALTLELGIFLVFLASLGGVLPLALATRDGLVLVVGTLVVGVILPLVLHLGFAAPHAPAGSASGRAMLAALCALAGGFLLRFGIVRVAPALLHQFPDITAADLEAPLWQSWLGKALLAGTLLLAMLIPWLLGRRWRLPGGQRLFAAGVSALVIAAVAVYSFSPASRQPVLDPTFGLSLSPEDARPRGGGPGASVSNRPVEPFLRSKLTATD
jgi:formate-dependent nitrite reductase membrane component NrfD